jgi:hypothetical protein
MDDLAAQVSPSLLAANRRLHELRAQARARRAESAAGHAELPAADQNIPGGDGLVAGRTPDVAEPDRTLTGLAALAGRLPAHLGWGSAPATTAARAGLARRPKADPAGGQVRLYPSIGLGMLQQEMAAPGRLWLMLRYLDEQGQGSLRIVIIHQHLTTKQTPSSVWQTAAA